jgi:hypothetical protein
MIGKNDDRIAPFRMHSYGYTGQVRAAFRENFNFETTYYNFMQKIIKETIKKDFKNFDDPIKVT